MKLPPPSPFALSLFLLGFTQLASCGGSGGNNGNGSGDACPAVQLNEACVPCVQAHCGSEIAQALGPNWANKEFGGACSSMTSCACSCSAGDDGCVSACMTQASVSCQQAELNVNQCTTQSCQTNCVLF